MTSLVHVALGSNLGDRQANLDRAIALLDELPETQVAARALVLTTPALLPEGATEAQPDYLNTVVALRTALAPLALLQALKAIEVKLGRTDTRRWRARPIDLDVVLWGDTVIDEPGLRVPHPQMHRRRFVLEPLAHLAPDARHPVLGESIQTLLDGVLRTGP